MNVIPLLLGSTAFVYIVKEITGPKDKKRKFDILELRDIDGISEDTKDIIKIITTSDDVPPVGSFKYRAHRYPSDIDIMERVKACCDATTAANAIAKRIQDIARQVNEHEDIFLGDFKAGIDDRFQLDIGELRDAKVFDYHPKKIRDELVNLRRQNLVTEEEFQDLLALVKPKPTVAEWEKLNDALRKLYVVRWNIQEILQGRKVLPGNKELTLAQALTQDSIVKIDLWAKLDGNYNEITNFFLIIAVDADGKETVLNQKLGDRLQSLEHDIQKYSSKEHRNSLKLAKRLWNKAIFQKDQKMLEKLYPLFGSGVNSLNQVAGEAEVIRGMLQKLENPPYPDLMRQIDGFKRRINDASYEADVDTESMYHLIDQITRAYKKYGKNLDRNMVLENLEELESDIKRSIEPYTKEYLKNVGIKL